MKDLELRKLTTKRKAATYTYQVIEFDKVIAERKSSREYVACYIFRHRFEDGSITYYLPYFFGRLDLIGKGSSQYAALSAYGLAKIKTNL